ncbi:related to zeta-crystallin / quinone reductase (NADPH) [Ramularia collo-cygni]|uniref:Related to zeta-crystallin / quinone reductase (NADPH) n=1 Tax=Ramularia collo-cygni TaxID=112498 RepID=A0A2D3V1N0_9PEZI|nr:related to zeta-crystallin / quinone reductase (NADPH) [Ramularia collo-cygni]CZT15409.1 related to zeta-crystallin / quinone reductase (NADPH) [Ramularia collo-cygni]
MKEAHVDADTAVTLHDVGIPRLTDPHQILIKVIVSGCNPKDWKMPAGLLVTIGDCANSGDDIAGIVHEVGSAVNGFHPGDRVAALHQLGAPYGSYAEYSVVSDHAIFHIGDRSFEEAAAIPMAYYMASVGLFGMLGLPMMWQHHDNDNDDISSTPLIIYGASGAVGSAAVQLAQNANLHPLICIAGAGAPTIQPLLDFKKGDIAIDYRKGADHVVEQMKSALDGRKLRHAFDCVSEKGSSENLCKVLSLGGSISLVLPSGAKDVPEGFRKSATMIGGLWDGFNNKSDSHILMGFNSPREFGYCYSSLIGYWFREGRLHVQKPEVVEGGLLGVEKALKSLRAGENHGVKYVVRVEDTPGLR